LFVLVFCEIALVGSRNGEIKMKRQLFAVITVVLLANVTAAVAKSTRKHPSPPPQARSIETPEAKYPPSDPYAVWVAGTYVGRDPDPNVRAAMIRDFYRYFDSR
jgi:hypothetical protein